MQYFTQYLIGAKTFRINFDKIDRFIRAYDRTRYFVLFGAEKYDSVYNRIRYLVGEKSNITYVIPQNYARIEVDFYDSLPLEKIMNVLDVIILINSFMTETVII